jgi:aryl-alcohol dehydrogenase (NADP+)
MEHLESLLGADEHRLPVEVLDRIDELVPPGTCVGPDEAKWEPPGLRRVSTRRRHR